MKSPNKIEIDKIYGEHPFWDVFKHNFLKLFAVDILSRSFVALSGSLVFTTAFLTHQVMATGKSLDWMTLLVSIAPPTFLALYWVEKSRASEILAAIASWIKNKK